MIVPLDQIQPETLRAMAEAYVLKEGTDYGEEEVTFEYKVEQVLTSLSEGEAVLLYSELHETVEVIPADRFKV